MVDSIIKGLEQPRWLSKTTTRVDDNCNGRGRGASKKGKLHPQTDISEKRDLFEKDELSNLKNKDPLRIVMLAVGVKTKREKWRR